MESDIKAGDLVMVVKPTPCCGDTTSLGLIFRVVGFSPWDGICLGCGRNGDPQIKLALVKKGNGKQLHRLIKIDPPAQPESTETRKEITA